MELNLTLLGQMLTFAFFVWFTMRFVWPMLEDTLNKRQDKVAEGLAAAERGHKELELAWKFCVQQMREARSDATKLIEQAKLQAAQILEQAKAEAKIQQDKILALGRTEIERERQEAGQKLKGEVVNLVINSTEKLLKRTLTEEDQRQLLEIPEKGKHGG